MSSTPTLYQHEGDGDWRNRSIYRQAEEAKTTAHNREMEMLTLKGKLESDRCEWLFFIELCFFDCVYWYNAVEREQEERRKSSADIIAHDQNSAQWAASRRRDDQFDSDERQRQRERMEDRAEAVVARRFNMKEHSLDNEHGRDRDRQRDAYRYSSSLSQSRSYLPQRYHHDKQHHRDGGKHVMKQRHPRDSDKKRKRSGDSSSDSSHSESMDEHEKL